MLNGGMTSRRSKHETSYTSVCVGGGGGVSWNFPSPVSYVKEYKLVYVEVECMLMKVVVFVLGVEWQMQIANCKCLF